MNSKLKHDRLTFRLGLLAACANCRELDTGSSLPESETKVFSPPLAIRLGKRADSGWQAPPFLLEGQEDPASCIRGWG